MWSPLCYLDSPDRRPVSSYQSTPAARRDIYRRWISAGYVADLGEAVRRDEAQRQRWISYHRAHPRRDVQDAALLRASRRQRRINAARTALLAAGAACHYCGGGHRLGVDHVRPRSQGGTDAPWNLVLACVRCNSAKGGKTVEQWRAQRAAAGLPWPPVWPARPQAPDTRQAAA
ncbi:HNH endonuclease signature motif containing protein [Micromonospora sp. NPDC049891]|uniref:HNH endonuclease n=1 Tax=Micromonospora sp. NPDC049891 TaxID=3155655 RepID=UPI0033C4C352